MTKLEIELYQGQDSFTCLGLEGYDDEVLNKTLDSLLLNLLGELVEDTQLNEEKTGILTKNAPYKILGFIREYIPLEIILSIVSTQIWEILKGNLSTLTKNIEIGEIDQVKQALRQKISEERAKNSPKEDINESLAHLFDNLI